MKNFLFSDSILDHLNNARKKAAKKGIKCYKPSIKAYCENKLNKLEVSAN
jgi:hypothetical protein